MPWQIRELYKFLTIRTLIVRARNTAYAEENVKEAFESIGIHPLNPRTVLGKLKPERSGESRNIARPAGCFESSPPRAINRIKRHALWMANRNAPSSKSKLLIDQFGRAAEGAVAGKVLSAHAGMLKDLRSEAKDLYPAVLETAARFLKLG